MERRGNFFVVLSLAAGLLGLSTTIGVAADHRPSAEAWAKYFLRLGYSAVPYDENGVVSVGGSIYPGANISLDPSYSPYFELGYYLSPNFSLSLASGYPPTVTAQGAGSIAAFGALGKVTGGIIELNGQYHFTDFGAFQPYVGGGPAYFHVFDTKDGALSQFGVKDAFGFNVELGADLMMSKNVGLFVDVKKVFMSTTSTGMFDFGGGPTPVNTDVRLDPTIISAGLTLRY